VRVFVDEVHCINGKSPEVKAIIRFCNDSNNKIIFNIMPGDWNKFTDCKLARMIHNRCIKVDK
jgi:hypothetical protein